MSGLDLSQVRKQLDAVFSGSVERAVSARVERIQREMMRHATAVVHLSQATNRRRNQYRWTRPAPPPPRRLPSASAPSAGSAPPPPLMGVNVQPPNQPQNQAGNPQSNHQVPPEQHFNQTPYPYPHPYPNQHLIHPYHQYLLQHHMFPFQYTHPYTP
uniref:pleckstrin homology-like domain family A member 1 n=1 Tax=Osmia lignaria TaxID=473952 RepID=UPI0014784C02|nr:pleckstrin homology-like domain family A member 1 [Osmia lignaria]XP_034195305.1 pleckstrin homology-like domain family A member 1 [Osmia lignaria]